jgi:periplasmic protein CpxP/Spy
MNLKNLLALSATSTLILVASTGLPFSGNAAIAQANESSVEAIPNARVRYLDKLNLTDAQKTKLKEIRESSREKMKAILTPEQQEKLRTARAQKKKPTDLNLTEDQKTKLKALRASTKTEIMAVLTPEQKQKLQELREAKKAEHNKQ